MTTKAGGSIQICAPRQDEKKWSTSVATRCTSESSWEVCLRETGRAPIKTRWVETDKEQSGKPKVRARWIAKEYKTNTRPELYASWPPLNALKVVVSESATGKRGGKVVALVDVRRAYFYDPARREVFAELPLEDYYPGDEHMCGLLRNGLYGTPHNVGRRSWHRHSASSADARVRVERLHQGRGRWENGRRWKSSSK